ncbi:MAG: response regulator [Deltaproteobacteria bacterium HGW-Deltaproteobacteria-21]|nr:MAG: response regulator [Deltaproteobacteria bacterium HGW-Deltaproteobacteria-21]
MVPKKSILIVEDDQNVLSMIVKHLRKAGYNPIQAADGLEALRKLEEDDFDLVITDVVIPYISGVGVVSAFKKKRPHVPVIAMTGYGKEPEAAAVEKNADLVLAKPVKMSSLISQIATLIGSSPEEDRP